METWQTFGHGNAKKVLDLQLKSGKLAHAYLFCGPQGIGKKTLALELAGKILNTQNLNTHPDFVILDQTEEIGVERTAQFMEGLSYKPFVGAKKVAIINNAELMNIQSSNALLKTLEEPSQSTILILVSANKNFLATIVSRCQTFNFNNFSLKQLKEFADKEGLQSSEEILKLSFGSVSKLLQLQNRDELAKQDKSIKDFEQIKAGAKADRLLAIAKFADLEALDLKQLFASWLMWARQSNYSAMLALLGALQQLNTNKNKKLILQDLFLKIS
jgi:DNA polymerase-3 subunit delta'